MPNTKDQNNNVLNDKSAILKRWKQHSRQLLNERREVDPSILHEFPPCNHEHTNEQGNLREEVELALKSMKNRKAGELLKYGGEPIIEYRHKLMSKCWDNNQIPDEWGRSNIVTLYKKSDPLICSNYRPRSLLIIARKRYTSKIKRRMNMKLEEVFGEEQAGFC